MKAGTEKTPLTTEAWHPLEPLSLKLSEETMKKKKKRK